MASIKKEVTKGVFWIAIAKYSGIIIQLIISAVLARLIAPAAFGTIALAMVVMHFFNMFTDVGIGPAVVQYKQLTKQHLDSLFTLNIYIGIILSLVFYGSSDLVSSYYGDETLGKICRIISIAIFFNSLNVVPNALMRKAKRFRTIALRTLFFQVSSGCIAVWGAFHNWGIYALLVTPMITAIGVFCVNYYNYPLRYILKMNMHAIRTIASFSVFQFAFSFCNYFSRNMDKFVIGKFFSLTQLGYYDKSYHLMQLPLQNTTFVIEPVLHPILSSLQNNKHELCKKNCKLAINISNISFPVGLILYFCGSELIRIIYGEQWEAAILVFKILALSLPLQMILSTSGALYQAAGETKHMFYNGLLNSIVTVSGFILAAYFGKSIEAVAWGWDVTLLLNFLTSYYIMHKFTFKDKAFLFYKSLMPQIINSAIVFISCLAIFETIQDLNIISCIIIKSIFILFATILCAIILRQYNLYTIIRYISRIGK